MFGRDREFNTENQVDGGGGCVGGDVGDGVVDGVDGDVGDGVDDANKDRRIVDLQVLARGEGLGAGFDERGDPGDEPGD